MASMDEKNQHVYVSLDDAPGPVVANGDRTYGGGSGGDSHRSIDVINRKKPSIRRSLSGVPVTIAWRIDQVCVKRSGSLQRCYRQTRQKINKNYEMMDDHKTLLSRVYGVAYPGRLLAIMGASGAGKTTLLNVLTNRNCSLIDIDGAVRVNGRNIGTDIRKISAYVQQDDLFIGTMKVREHLTFQASLVLGKKVSKAERKARVDRVISELGLGNCENTVIGGTRSIHRGISAGERKRLAFASEILIDPPILFCDEPTSGLDSFMALQVVEVLKHMAEKGKTIVCTIHQPSSQVFDLFDDLCLLAGGRIVYLGPAKQAAAFFDSCGYVCPINFNPADHYIRVLATVPCQEHKSRERIKKIRKTYEKSSIRESIIQSVETKTGNGGTQTYGNIQMKKSRYKATWWQQFCALSWRSWLSCLRDPMLIPTRFMQTLIVSIILGLVYYDTKLEGSTGIQNVTGLLFMFVTNMTFQYAFGVVDTFCQELPILLREHFSGVYRVSPYYMAKVISELPQYIVFPSIFATILYFMGGLERTASIFFILLGICLLTANVAVSLGYMISCVFGDLNLALTSAPIIVIPFMMFGGFYINADSVPVYLQWFQYLSYFKYSYEALVINQFQHLESIPGCTTNASCPSTGLEVLQTLSFDPSRFALDIGILVIMLIVIRLISIFALMLRARRAN